MISPLPSSIYSCACGFAFVCVPALVQNPDDTFVLKGSRELKLRSESYQCFPFSPNAVNKHKPWLEPTYHGIVTENDNAVLLDPPLIALDKDSPLRFAGMEAGCPLSASLARIGSSLGLAG